MVVPISPPAAPLREIANIISEPRVLPCLSCRCRAPQVLQRLLHLPRELDISATLAHLARPPTAPLLHLAVAQPTPDGISCGTNEWRGYRRRCRQARTSSSSSGTYLPIFYGEEAMSNV